ncbi:hypothetical protein P7D22_20845 [Lichenihabitans sp. Uapishka_5]|uniref:hypothetical protein n=1 Tax=Lichenihabitans sp. Uapishka_5 TaxID=3037302 RepID=UPI0029E82203|nr:hypothetical protein [Lichenihabitans sp. Uapishka_5]MDX7953615.1 hypothetical protein [Lichenihabitans sp. Uapishka_5]
MNPGSVFFDEEFAFHDGQSGEKLFLVLGSDREIAVVAKTTSRQHGRGNTFGCQTDRFYNFFLPPQSCYLRKPTWVCLDEFYEVRLAAALSKSLRSIIKPVCTIEHSLLRLIQECAKGSLDITDQQHDLVHACLAT